MIQCSDAIKIREEIIIPFLQHLDYNHWYDRTKLTLKEIHNVQYVACMNPTAGSFTINSRLQRHFSVFAISFPGLEALK